jgi:hypothetical protein
LKRKFSNPVVSVDSENPSTDFINMLCGKVQLPLSAERLVPNKRNHTKNGLTKLKLAMGNVANELKNTNTKECKKECSFVVRMLNIGERKLNSQNNKETVKLNTENVTKSIISEFEVEANYKTYQTNAIDLTNPKLELGYSFLNEDEIIVDENHAISLSFSSNDKTKYNEVVNSVNPDYKLYNKVKESLQEKGFSFFNDISESHTQKDKTAK